MTPSMSTASIDPIFAAIEAHKRARAAAYPDEPGPDTGKDPAWDRLYATEERLLQSLGQDPAPATVAGAAALLSYIFEVEGCYIENQGTAIYPVAKAVTAALARLVSPTSDPVFEAIKTHRKLFETNGACASEERALEELFQTLPTTLPGLKAAIEHMVFYNRGCVPETSGRYLEALLKSPILAGLIEVDQSEPPGLRRFRSSERSH